MVCYTTFFDSNYLSRGLVLYDSLKINSKNSFQLYVLCLDDFSFNFFNKKNDSFPEVKPIKLSDLEDFDTELKETKKNRKTIEYYFTISPCLPLFILKKYGVSHICSLDADILFLNTPESIFEDLLNYSIIITPHKFSPQIATRKKYGLYNVSFQIFKNDVIGKECLERWRYQCINWCKDEFDEKTNRFADQKYLDNWAELYKDSIKVLDDNVSGIAPWNLNNYELAFNDGKFYSNDEALIFYHFHHFKFFRKKWASTGFYNYKVKIQKAIDILYRDYWDKLTQKANEIELLTDNSTRGVLNKNLLIRLLEENHVYYKLKNGNIIHINFTFIPLFFKKIVINLYGRIATLKNT
jgi:hypothetical protein